MITSFFKTSKPIHFFIVSVLVLVLFVFYRKENLYQNLNLYAISHEILMYFVVLATLAIQSFVVTKNNLTKKNSYNILLFVLIIACIPEVLKDNNLIWANFFIVLALRRILSLKSNIAVKKKLFDAALWIGIASLFYFWSILFFTLIILALLLFALGQYKNWIIPFLALGVLAIIVMSYSIIVYDSFFQYNQYIDSISLNFNIYTSTYTLIGLYVVLTFALWALVFYFKKIAELVRVKRSSYVLVFYTLVLAFIYVLVSPQKTAADFIFTLSPLAIITTNYIEIIKRKWLANVFLFTLILTAIVVLVLHLNTIS